MPPKKETPESIYKIYFDLVDKYSSIYGKSTVVLLQVGAFFEIYGYKSKKTDEIGKSEIVNVSNLTQLSIALKGIEYEDGNILMAGFRDHRLEFYVQKLIENNITVVVYVQKKDGKNITRELYQVYSPGSFIPYEIENTSLSNHTMCIWFDSYNPLGSTQENIVYGISSVNIFTGETTIFENDTLFLMNPTTFDELERYVSVIVPSEVLVISKFDEKTTNTFLQYSGIKTSVIHKFLLNSETLSDARKTEIENCTKQKYIYHILSTFFGEECYYVCKEFQTYSIATQAFCFLMNFVQSHNPDLVKRIGLPCFNNVSSRMSLANNTLKQLNIINDDSEDAKMNGKLSSISSFLNKCCSAIGRRRFHNQITNPSFDIEWLKCEYAMISELLNERNVFLIDVFRKQLGKIRDLEKISRQIILKKIYPSSIYHLYKSIQGIREMNGYLLENPDLSAYLCDEISFFANANGNANENVNANVYIHSLTTEVLAYMDSKLIIEKCAGVNTMNSMDENIIIQGISENVDKISREYNESCDLFDKIRLYFNTIMKNQTSTSDDTDYIKVHETEKSGSSLQITKKRTSTLKPLLEKAAQLIDGEKTLIITPTFQIPLKDVKFVKSAASSKTNDEIEFPQLSRVIRNIMSLKESLSEEISKEYLKFLGEFERMDYEKIIRLSKYIAKIDVLQSKAYVAKEYNYCCPILQETAEKSFVHIRELRHPLIEHIQQNELYVTNDICLGIEDDETKEHIDGILIYGTNAVGKTSFIRAVGISVIMAQSGMYVPCSYFQYKPYSAIFSRILGNDNIFKGLSTFAVEMSELRIILKMADESSLILGDELCSGTETESALSIFSAGLMDLHEKKSTFLFATHFHEICKYEEILALERLKLKHMSVHYDKEKDCLVYDRKLRGGTGNRMYGLEVCQSLYLPQTFLEKAYEIRSKYFETNRGELSHSPSQYNKKKIRGKCEICNDELAKETHHLSPQRLSNQDGFIGSFHKNHTANLASVCEKCHTEIHKDESLEKPELVKRKKTTKGYLLTK
jgi:DNA mismatch repair protein MutS